MSILDEEEFHHEIPITFLSRFLPHLYFHYSHGKIGTFRWNLIGGAKSEKYKVVKHNVMGSTKLQNQDFFYRGHSFLFPKSKKEHIGKFKKRWFNPYKIQYCLSNNIILLVNIDKFEPNPILVNINKLKPYWYLDKILKGLKVTIERGGEHKEDL
jgi:hypothetical protein